MYLWVVAVESERSEVRVVALDPVGLLGVVRPRVGIRFHIRSQCNRRLAPLRYTYIVRHLIARAGLPARIDEQQHDQSARLRSHDSCPMRICVLRSTASTGFRSIGITGRIRSLEAWRFKVLPGPRAG